MCLQSKCKGTLACHLVHAELMSDSAQVQKWLYEQLQADKIKEAEYLRYECEALQLWKKCMEDQLEDIQNQLEEAWYQLCLLHMGSTTGRNVAIASKAVMKAVNALPLVSTSYL